MVYVQPLKSLKIVNLFFIMEKRELLKDSVILYFELGGQVTKDRLEEFECGVFERVQREYPNCNYNLFIEHNRDSLMAIVVNDLSGFLNK